MNKKMMFVLAAIAIVIASSSVTAKAYAQAAPNGGDRMQSLVQKLASRFGLKTSDVQAVFDQDRTDRRAAMQANYEARLTRLVKDGKITEAQKTLILAKHQELAAKRQSEMQAMQGKTAEERRALMQSRKTVREAERTEIEAWAKANGIDVTYVMGFGGMGHGPRDGMGR